MDAVHDILHAVDVGSSSALVVVHDACGRVRVVQPVHAESAAKDAAKAIIKGLGHRPDEIRFPKRMHYLLQSLGTAKIWHKYIVPKLATQ